MTPSAAIAEILNKFRKIIVFLPLGVWLSATHAAAIHTQCPSFTPAPRPGEGWKRAPPICLKDEAKAQGGSTRLPNEQGEALALKAVKALALWNPLPREHGRQRSSRGRHIRIGQHVIGIERRDRPFLGGSIPVGKGARLDPEGERL
jgi:hypothetical protein